MGYSEQTKQAAYELFRGNQQQSMDQLAAGLAALPQGQAVPVDTIRDWRNRYHWDKRVQQEIADASPVLIQAHVSLARVAGLEGLTYLRDVANGLESYDKQRVEVAKFLVEEVRPMLKFAVGDEPPVPLQTGRQARVDPGLPAEEYTPGWVER